MNVLFSQLLVMIYLLPLLGFLLAVSSIVLCAKHAFFQR